MLLSRPPLSPPRRTRTVRLACFRHAASVYPEPGSNSPSELSESIPPPLGFRNDLSTISLTDRHAPHHSSIVNVPQARHVPAPARHRRPHAELCCDRLISMPVQERRGQGAALAPTDCPRQLPAQYRRRWGVSRPCSGRERVGPPRRSHQGHLDRIASARPRAVGTAPVWGVAGTRGRAGGIARRWGVSRSCRPGVVHGDGR